MYLFMVAAASSTGTSSIPSPSSNLVVVVATASPSIAHAREGLKRERVTFLAALVVFERGK